MLGLGLGSQRRLSEGFVLIRSVIKSTARAYHKLAAFARASLGASHPPTVNHACMDEQEVNWLTTHPTKERNVKITTPHQMRSYVGRPVVRRWNMRRRENLTAQSVAQKKI